MMMRIYVCMCMCMYVCMSVYVCACDVTQVRALYEELKTSKAQLQDAVQRMNGARDEAEREKKVGVKAKIELDRVRFHLGDKDTFKFYSQGDAGVRVGAADVRNMCTCVSLC